MTRMAGAALSEQAAPFMAVLADPRASQDEQALAAIQLSELMNARSELMNAQRQAQEAWPTNTVSQQKAAAIAVMDLMQRHGKGPGMDPRDYRTDDGLWRSELLPWDVSIDQAIQDGIW